LTSLERRLEALERAQTPAADRLAGVGCVLCLHWPEDPDKPRWRCRDAAGGAVELSDADALAVFLSDAGSDVVITWPELT